jgi:divalent metal cation (Fe/Co/Zn/Cd) transporter
VVLFGENAAAVLGLIVALIALGLTVATGDPRWDSVGSLLIGVVLIGVAIFLAREVMSLLLGERADPQIEIVVKEVALTQPNIKRLIRVLTVQQGPGEVMVACKVHLIDELDTRGVVETIDAFELAIHARVPDIRWLFVEPDDDD